MRSISISVSVAAVLAAAALAACSGTREGPGRPPAPGPTGGAPGADPVAAQAQDGAAHFAQVCAKCHGAGGEGTANAPALIGPGALPTTPPPTRRLRTGPFASAKDIGMFVKDRMPPGSSTPPDRTAAVLAYLLTANGVRPAGPIDPSSAAAIPWRR